MPQPLHIISCAACLLVSTHKSKLPSGSDAQSLLIPQERRPREISSGPLDPSRLPPQRGPGIATYHIPKGETIHIPKGLAAATAEKLFSDRARIQDGVFRPGYNLPTMTVEEWGARAGRLPFSSRGCVPAHVFSR